MHLTTQFLANEEKAIMATSKVEALEAETSELRRDLIAAMDVHNTSKEQVKVLTEQLGVEKLLTKQKDNLLASTSQNVRKYVFHMLRTYVLILCNWLIL